MVSNVVFIFCLVISIFHHGECIVTDKEYASLPAIFEQDNFDRCMLFEDEALYCSVEFHLKPLDTHKPSLAWQKIQELNSDPNNYHHDNLRHGICVPLTCPNISTSYKELRFKEDLADCYSKKYEKDGLYGKIGYMHCQTAEGPPFDVYDYLVAIISVIYILLIIYASFYEGLARYESKEKYEELTGTTYGKILSCFSITKNWIRLKTVTWTPELKALKSIQGVRVYSMLLVVICHASMMAGMTAVSNTKYIENLPQNPMTILIGSGPYGVEGFFLISSWMLTYNVFKHFDKQSGKKLDMKTVFNIFIQRYIRLTPPMAVIIILHSTLIYHASTGPWWDIHVGRDRVSCRQNGWTNLLYMNNLINPSRMCMIETWYMAVDMHGFFLVLTILYFTVKKPNVFGG
ncbi:hypothetical protein WA026_023100 [Henosepilachna vigintioctopunctata]|uniref:Acyltransferase 3 domain-containing protein n=1 Tax=Henosepilachna vigintioctopunctata TaxID=420089 RepID=A0AAW1U7W3_9CUCU